MAQVIDNFQARGECEFMAEFAEPFSARVITGLLGLEEQLWPKVADLATKLGYVFSVTIKEDLPMIEEGLLGILDLAKDLIHGREGSDRDDFVGRAALSNPTPGPRLYALKGEGKRAARAGYQVFLPGSAETLGEITSGVLSPTLGYPIGFAYLSGEVETGTKLEADVRGTRVGCEVVKTPFYRRENG